MDSQKTTISRYNNLSSRYSENIAFALTKFLRKSVNPYTKALAKALNKPKPKLPNASK